MLHLRKLWLAFLVAIIVLALAPTSGWGQNGYGTIAGTELAGASSRTTSGHGAAPERPQSAGVDRYGAGRRDAGHPVGWQFLGGQSRWRQSVRSRRFSGWRRHGRAEPDPD